jgi:hypothetical protein
MALINSINQEIHCKVVYFGSFYGGKATNLQYIYSQTLPVFVKRKLIHLPVEK